MPDTEDVLDIVLALSALVDQARQDLLLAERRGVGARRAEIRLQALQEALDVVTDASRIVPVRFVRLWVN